MSAFQRLLNYYPQIRWWSCLLILVSLVLSKFLLSVGMIALTLTSILHPDFRVHLKKAISTPFLAMWLLIIIVFIFSGINSDDHSMWLYILKKKTPFLFLPIAFAGFVPFSKNNFLKLVVCFVLFILACCGYTLVNYIRHYESITYNYIYGQVMPTPVDHIRFSLLIAIAIVMGAYCAVEYWKLNKRVVSYIVASITLFLFLFLHLLAVRSGLLAIYLVLLYALCYRTFILKQWLLSSILFLAILLAGLSSYFLVPSLQTKIKYMEYDLYCFFTGVNVNGHSDGGRLLSLQISKSIIQEHPLLGVGAGDAESSMKDYYRIHFPDIAPEHRMLPHNELMYMWLACGVLGPIVLLFLIFQLFFTAAIRHNWLYIGVVLIGVSSLFFEPVLEIQIGTAIFIFFPLFLYAHLKKDAIA